VLIIAHRGLIEIDEFIGNLRAAEVAPDGLMVFARAGERPGPTP